ncbi:hypothetical protein D3C81_366190 [compost metagenome]
MNPTDPNQITIADIGQFLDALKSRPGFTFHTASPNRNGVVYGQRIPTHNPTIDALMSKNLLKNLPKELTHPSPVSMSVHAMPRDDGRRSKVFKLQCDGIEMVMSLPPGEYVEQPAEWQGSVPHPKAKYYDPLSFGTALHEPDMFSHIDVVDAAGNRVDVMAVPQRHLQGEFEPNPYTLPKGTVEEMARIQKKFVGGDTIDGGLVPHTHYPELLGMTKEEPDDLRHNPDDDLYQEANPANWDVLHDEDSAPAAHDVLGEEDK